MAFRSKRRLVVLKKFKNKSLFIVSNKLMGNCSTAPERLNIPNIPNSCDYLEETLIGQLVAFGHKSSYGSPVTVEDSYTDHMHMLQNMCHCYPGFTTKAERTLCSTFTNTKDRYHFRWLGYGPSTRPIIQNSIRFEDYEIKMRGHKHKGMTMAPEWKCMAATLQGDRDINECAQWDSWFRGVTDSAAGKLEAFNGLHGYYQPPNKTNKTDSGTNIFGHFKKY